MNTTLKNVILNRKNHFNQEVVNGLATTYMKDAVTYLDSIIRSAITGINPNLNIKYLGYRRLTPKEEFESQFKVSGNKNTIETAIVDIADNYLYKVEFAFEYEGELIKRLIALPYVERGGVLKLADANYVIVPVLSEFVINPSVDKVFVRLLKDKLIFRQVDRNITINGVKKPMSIVISDVYKLTKDVNKDIPIMLYPLIKFGFYNFFKKYFNTKPIVLKDNTLIPKYIDDENYVVYGTTGVKPRAVPFKNYRPHTVYIVVEKDKVTPFMESTIASIIYSFDMSPGYARNILNVLDKRKDIITVINYDSEDNLDIDSIDIEQSFWLIILGNVIFKNSQFTIDKIISLMVEHINVIDGYIDDTIIKSKLNEKNIVIDDFYDVLTYITENYNLLIMNSDDRSASLENRYIDILYYILYDIIIGINKAFFEMNRKSYTKKQTYRKIVSIFTTHLSTKKIYSITDKDGLNLALSPIDSVGDNYYPKITSLIEDQNRGSGVKKNKKNTFPKFTQTLHGIDLFFGNLFYLNKHSPSPRFKINPFVKIDTSTDRVIIDGDIDRRVDKIDKLLKGKIDDANELESVIIDYEELED